MGDDEGGNSAKDTYNIVKLVSEKRVEGFDYLKRLHLGSIHFLNTVKVSREDLVAFYPNSKMNKRSAQWFCLGISIAPLLQIEDPVDYIKSISLLMEEFEYESSDFATQKMKQIFRKTKEEEDVFMVNPSYQETGLYTHLQTPNVPFELDYIQVFYSLCDILISVYEKTLIINDKGVETQPGYRDAFLRLDARFKKISSTVTKEIHSLAATIIKQEVALVDPLFESINKQDEQDTGTISD